jgi:multidrug efflux pump
MSGVYFRGQDNNIFTQIGFVVLVGLACKNAILIVEFARQQMQVGQDRLEAAAEAARLRLRPILMTSFAFILGVLPLVIAKGAGAEMDQALGTAVFAGMIGVTFFGIFFTPVFFSIIMKLFGGRRKRQAGKREEQEDFPGPEETDEQLVGERE